MVMVLGLLELPSVVPCVRKSCIYIQEAISDKTLLKRQHFFGETELTRDIRLLWKLQTQRLQVHLRSLHLRVHSAVHQTNNHVHIEP